METKILKVAGRSSVPKVAGAIIKFVESGNKVEIHSIGASAISQTVKALTSARGVLTTKGYDISFTTGFGSTEIDGNEKTMIKFKINVL